MRDNSGHFFRAFFVKILEKSYSQNDYGKEINKFILILFFIIVYGKNGFALMLSKKLS